MYPLCKDLESLQYFIYSVCHSIKNSYAMTWEHNYKTEEKQIMETDLQVVQIFELARKFEIIIIYSRKLRKSYFKNSCKDGKFHQIIGIH